ncbi:MAG: nicotinamide mononucleotide transporter [Marinilabiliaceae bacterium]|nr:nicotinamide mononucleotide transporter [Marinilabiliaceae bacterium]
MQEWFFEIDRFVELVAMILSLLYLYFEVKENSLLWLVGIVSSALYAYVYFKSAFYADFGLMIYYVVISIYGWIHWHGSKYNNVNIELPIQSITKEIIIKLLLVTVLIYVSLLIILLYLPGYIGLSSSTFPYLDSLTVSASIVGTWMLTRKILQQWLVWIVINSICVVMFWIKGLNYTTLLFIIYTIGSVIGYIKWLKNFKNQQLIKND